MGRSFGRLLMFVGTLNAVFAVIQGWWVPDELQHLYVLSARDGFLLSSVAFAIGLRMYQKSVIREEQV